jgi:hypothetical protein
VFFQEKSAKSFSEPIKSQHKLTLKTAKTKLAFIFAMFLFKKEVCFA